MIANRILCAFLCAVVTSIAAAQSAPPSANKTISWDALLPKDWDPMKEFRETDMAQLKDNDPRAAAMLKRMRKVWDEAPVNPQMNGVAVRLPGYVVPLEETKAGLKEFLLVPYFGACIHTPPPPANQIIHVVLTTPSKLVRSMDAVVVNGKLSVERADTDMGVSGYRMSAATAAPYSESNK